VTYYGENMNMR